MTSVSDIANVFNKFYINVGQELASKIPNVNCNPVNYVRKLLNNFNGTFNFLSVSENDIRKLIADLPVNKATGLDNYQSRLIKLCVPGILPGLTLLFNK